MRTHATLALLRMSFAARYLPRFDRDSAQLLRNRPQARRTTLLVVGIKHFDPRLDDLNGQARQAQIASLIGQLAALRPTHVVMESPCTAQSKLDILYRRFRAGDYQPGRSELEQLGLRLAARCALQRVHCLGWDEQTSDEGCDWDTYGMSHGQADRVEAILETAPASPASMPAGAGMDEWLRNLNDPAALAANHRFFFDVAMIGDDASQPGAHCVAQWYARNLRVFSGISRLAAGPEDRVVVLYGYEHAYLLRQFARESGAYRVLDVQDVLGDSPRRDAAYT
jgi:Family of unknown function (DUF5694)